MKTRSELESMTVKTLRRYVIDRGLSFPYLGECTKAEIINKLIQFRAAREDNTPAPPKAESSGPKPPALATPTPAPSHPLPIPAARGVHIPSSNPAAPGVHTQHTTGDVDDLFFLYRKIVDDTSMSVDARAGYLTAAVRTDKRISRRLDSRPNDSLAALLRERLAAEDSEGISVPALAHQSAEEATQEMGRAEQRPASDE
ncbi:hypothetical protein DRW03_36310 [Corallococcus sp. H22C18031201]|nr:hypothetical protein DRW03_36310 [Corallococcus sp. H22C18031201]